MTVEFSIYFFYIQNIFPFNPTQGLFTGYILPLCICYAFSKISGNIFEIPAHLNSPSKLFAKFKPLSIVHSLSSGKVAATPILKSVPSQFSPFILYITVSWHAYKTILAQSRPQRWRQRENYSNLLSLDG